MLLIPAFETWLRRYGRAESTIKTYRKVLRTVEDLDDPVSRLSDTSLSPKYRALLRAALKSYARFAQDTGTLGEIENIRLPPAKRLRSKSPLTQKQFKKLLRNIKKNQTINRPILAVILMLLARGFRVGDVLRLTQGEIEEATDTRVLNFLAKGSKRMEFGVTKHWADALYWLLEGFSQHFGSKGSTQVWEILSKSPNAAHARVAKALQKLAKGIGLSPSSVHPHLLRKTYATNYYILCQDPVKLRDHMQWASIETAMLYVAGEDRKKLDSIADEMF